MSVSFNAPFHRGIAHFAGRTWRGVVESIDALAQPERLNEGRWIVVGTFEGEITAWRFETVGDKSDADLSDAGQPHPGEWLGPEASTWTSSMDRAEYTAAVEQTREHIRDGDVYQANICRVLSAPLPGTPEPDAEALHRRLVRGNPAPYAGMIHVPAGLTSASGEPIAPVWIVSASPELFLSLSPDGTISSSPIKGTATRAEELREKDRAENVMITDLVRNDLQQVCEPGTIRVSPFLDVEHHPGLVHLVSTVHGQLRGDSPERWRAIFDATFPPGSVSGAPKSSALEIIGRLETAPRGPYCGAIGWVDAEAGTAQLAVGIRTFWWEQGVLRFGTGAGITWGSDPESEWAETELKARRLIGLASRHEQRVSASDHGLLLGDGLFETFLVRDGEVRDLDAHLARLRGSCERMGIELHHDDAALTAKALDAAATADGGQARVRITVTSGEGPAGFRRGSGLATVIVTASPFIPNDQPLTAVTLPWRRNENSPIAGLKTLSMAENVLAARFAEPADEGIWLNTRGELCEGTATNVFVDLGDRIVTPPLDSGCLPGVARRGVIAAARENGVPLAEETLDGAILERVRAGEIGMFLTSAVRGIAVVAELDGHPVRRCSLTDQLRGAAAATPG